MKIFSNSMPILLISTLLLVSCKKPDLQNKEYIKNFFHVFYQTGKKLNRPILRFRYLEHHTRGLIKYFDYSLGKQDEIIEKAQGANTNITTDNFLNLSDFRNYLVDIVRPELSSIDAYKLFNDEAYAKEKDIVLNHLLDGIIQQTQHLDPIFLLFVGLTSITSNGIALGIQNARNKYWFNNPKFYIPTINDKDVNLLHCPSVPYRSRNSKVWHSTAEVLGKYNPKTNSIDFDYHTYSEIKPALKGKDGRLIFNDRLLKIVNVSIPLSDIASNKELSDALFKRGEIAAKPRHINGPHIYNKNKEYNHELSNGYYHFYDQKLGFTLNSNLSYTGEDDWISIDDKQSDKYFSLWPKDGKGGGFRYLTHRIQGLHYKNKTAPKETIGSSISCPKIEQFISGIKRRVQNL